MAYYEVGDFKKYIGDIVELFRQLRIDLTEEIEDIKSNKDNAELEYDGKYYLRDDVVDKLTDLEHCRRECEKIGLQLMEDYLEDYYDE